MYEYKEKWALLVLLLGTLCSVSMVHENYMRSHATGSCSISRDAWYFAPTHINASQITYSMHLEITQ